MTRIVCFSEAALIGLHGMVLVARSGATVNVQKIADLSGSSRHHVAKVMQRLVKDGFLLSNRGPAGGFHLTRDPKEISLLQIYESIEGKVNIPGCQRENLVCPFGKCLFGNIVPRMTALFREHFEATTLGDMM